MSHRPVRRAALVLAALLAAGLGSLVPLGTPAVATTAAAAAPAPTLARPAKADPPHLQQGWYDAMGLAKAHRVTRGKGAVVAVVDTYLDPTVPDLKGADVSLRTNCEGLKVPLRKDNNANHGTAMVTAIVGQGTGNAAGGRGVLGVAPEAQVRFYSLDTKPDNDRVECDGAASSKMLLKAARDGADVISISGTGLASAEDAIAKIVKMGVVVVAASGSSDKKDSVMGTPAAFPGVVSVLACDNQGHPWASNPGRNRSLVVANSIQEWPVITAPGVDTELGAYDFGAWKSGYARTGTSGATAIAAGAFALLKSRYPEATGAQLIQAVIHTASSFTDNKVRWYPNFGYGLLAVNTALTVDPTKYPDVNPLLKGPDEVKKEFPPSSYGAASAGSSASASPSPQASAASQAGGAPTTKSSAQQPADGGGVPIWVWPLALVALLAAAGAAYAARRKASTSTTRAPEMVPRSNDRNQGE